MVDTEEARTTEVQASLDGRLGLVQVSLNEAAWVHVSGIFGVRGLLRATPLQATRCRRRWTVPEDGVRLLDRRSAGRHSQGRQWRHRLDHFCPPKVRRP